MDANEVVRVDLGLLAGRQLLASVYGHRRCVSAGKRRDRLAVRRREVDLLGCQLGRDLAMNKGIPPEKEPRAERQDADDADLEDHHSPPHCHWHVTHLFENFLRFHTDGTPPTRLAPIVPTS